MYDYSKLLGKITEVYGTQVKFATAVGISQVTLSMKLKDKRGISREDIETWCEALEIPKEEIPDYFFARK